MENNFETQNNMPMKWFKFLIYFSLFANAVLNVITGIMCLTGSQYDGAADLVYAFFDGLKTVDLIYGVVLIALAVLAIYTRIRLAGFYANGPKLLNTLYIANTAIALIYLIAVQAIVGDTVEINMTSSITSMVVSIVMVVANTVYFKKRANLFVK